MSDDREIELKLACTPRDFAAALAAAPAGEERTRVLTSVYFDTPDGKLAKAGVALRVRDIEGVRTQTLKRGAGLSREEYEKKIKGEQPDDDLGPLKDLLDKAARASLAPVFEIAVTRRERRISHAGADIELAADDGEARAGAERSPIAEVELELKAGEPAALFELARLLADAAPLYLSFEGKADRGRALAGGAPAAAPALPADISAAGAFQSLARRTLSALTRHAAKLRTAPDVEAVHQTRVAARRLRSLIVTFKPVLAGSETERLKAELKWLARACDQARDLDVFAGHIERLEEASAPAGLADLTGALEAARGAARSKAAMAVSGPRFRRLAIDLCAWIETADWTRAKSPSAADFAGKALAKRRQSLLKRGKGLETLTDAERHKARIEAKKLRYAAEGFAELFPGKAAERFIERLKALQDDLGALNDLATAEPLVGRLDLPADAAFAAGELVGLKTAERPERLKHAARALKRLAETDVFW
jgi:triphosphatase